MKNTPFDLTGKVAVITGSSRGIGRSSAELLAKLGAKVVISSRKADACHEVAEGIKKAGGDAHVIPCNISRREEVEALISGTTKHYGKVDILVCNAAVNPYYGPLLDIKDEAFDKIMGSNVKSNIWLCALAIPQMAERGNGSVVIISSIGGLRGSTVIGAYGISKAADFALCRSLAGEWGPKGVRVNCVAPGLVKTDFARALWEDPENLKRRTSGPPLRRIGEPEEIAGAVAYLASDAVDLHDRPDHRGRRRRDDRGDVDSLPLPLAGEGAERSEAGGVSPRIRLSVCCVRARLGRRRARRHALSPQAGEGAHRARGRHPHIDLRLPIGLPLAQPTILSGEATSCPLCWPSIRAPRRRAPSCFAATFPSPPRRSRNSRSISRPPAGSSTSRRRSGPRRVAVCRDALAQGGPQGKGHRRDRHHQPARDHGGLGPRDRRADAPRHRLAGPPHRRRLRAAEGRGPRAAMPARTGLLLDPYFSGTKIAWMLDHVPGARAARRGAASWPSAPSTASCCGG